ncbi:MAG: c-type cytochrome [Luminiphilus sp.]|nr:c-type cytochrome [Luminiphilus sp.]MDG2036730.1 c-type cytochrome [Luminiphilus sp.]
MFQFLAKVACVLAVTVIGTNVQAAGDAEAGQAKAATCVACHGVDGNSAVPTFPKLSGLGHKYLLKQMQDIRDGRRPVALMAGQVDNMTDQDLSDIAAFYDAQPRSGGSADPDKVSLGRKVYLGGIAERQVPACSGCHSPTGNGNGPAVYPALAGQHADYVAAQLKMFRKGYEDPAGRTNGGEAKIMRTTAFRMSDMEIEAVASYIAGLQPTP